MKRVCESECTYVAIAEGVNSISNPPPEGMGY